MNQHHVDIMREQLRKKYLQEQHTAMYTSLLEIEVTLKALEILPEELILYTTVSDQGQPLPVANEVTVKQRKTELTSGLQVLTARVKILEDEYIKIWNEKE